MNTTTKTATTKKAPKVLTGQALFEHRMAIINRNSNPLKIKEKGRNIWNLKPYKD